MSTRALFEAAFPYGKDLLALPVRDVNEAARWYAEHFGMSEVERVSDPYPAVVLQRDGVRIGFSVNGADSAAEGAAILVSDIHAARAELEGTGIVIGHWRVDERDGKKFQVFFVVAPDGLCYYFHQPIDQ